MVTTKYPATLNLCKENCQIAEKLMIRPHKRKCEVRALYHHKVRGDRCHKKHGQAAQRKRRATGHNSSRAERRNQSEYELKLYLEDNYNCMQHTNSYREFPKEPVSQEQNTKVSENISTLQEPNLKRDYREADGIQCQPAKQQTSDRIMKSTKHGNLDMSITDVCSKSQASSTRQISEKSVKEDIRNELTGKKKTKKGFSPMPIALFLLVLK